jgi:hypothetical protein
MNSMHDQLAQVRKALFADIEGYSESMELPVSLNGRLQAELSGNTCGDDSLPLGITTAAAGTATQAATITDGTEDDQHDEELKTMNTNALQRLPIEHPKGGIHRLFLALENQYTVSVREVTAFAEMCGLHKPGSNNFKILTSALEDCGYERAMKRKYKVDGKCEAIYYRPEEVTEGEAIAIHRREAAAMKQLHEVYPQPID